jgi:sugar phosphate isomerase/epimerase
MPRTRSRRTEIAAATSRDSSGRARRGARHLEGRLGIDQPAGWWPTTPRLKSYEAAGFSHLQMRMPPREVLADAELVRIHADAVHDNLSLTGLELIVHAPDDLRAGSPEHDRQLSGALEYAARAGAELLVYHRAQVPLNGPRVRRVLEDEEQSLRHAARLATAIGMRIAIENLAPVYPGPELVSHNVHAVHELVRRLDGEQVGMCLDIGHANIAAGIAECDVVELIEPVLDRVLLFHVHDNFGARWGGSSRSGGALASGSGGLEPLRLDLHLPPGAGTVPWAALEPLLVPHAAPLQLEVHPAARPEPANLAIVTREVLRPRGPDPEGRPAPEVRPS